MPYLTKLVANSHFKGFKWYATSSYNAIVILFDILIYSGNNTFVVTVNIVFESAINVIIKSFISSHSSNAMTSPTFTFALNYRAVTTALTLHCRLTSTLICHGNIEALLVACVRVCFVRVRVCVLLFMDPCSLNRNKMLHCCPAEISTAQKWKITVL